MSSYLARRRAVLRAERRAEVARQVRAEIRKLEGAERDRLEAIAEGRLAGLFTTPERAAAILAAGGYEPDPPPAWLFPELPLPAYMPAGAPRPLSVRETVQTLNRFGSRVPLRLVLLLLRITLRELTAELLGIITTAPAPDAAASSVTADRAHPPTGPPCPRPCTGSAVVISP